MLNFHFFLSRESEGIAGRPISRGLECPVQDLYPGLHRNALPRSAEGSVRRLVSLSEKTKNYSDKKKSTNQKQDNDGYGIFENRSAANVTEENESHGDNSTKNENKYDTDIHINDWYNASKNISDLTDNSNENTKNNKLLNFIEDRLTPHVVSVDNFFRKPRKSFLNFDGSTSQDRLHFSRGQSRERNSLCNSNTCNNDNSIDNNNNHCINNDNHINNCNIKNYHLNIDNVSNNICNNIGNSVSGDNCKKENDNDRYNFDRIIHDLNEKSLKLSHSYSEKISRPFTEKKEKKKSFR